MASNFLKSTTTLLLIFYVLSYSNAQIVDTDGEALIYGVEYYIVPQDISVNGGLYPIYDDKTPLACPYHISRLQDETAHGIPVTFSYPDKSGFIVPGTPISISFLDVGFKFCNWKWKVVDDEKTGQSFVTVSSHQLSHETETFQIEGDGVYTIKYNKDKYVGFSEKEQEELLAITDNPLPVKFRKVPVDILNVLAMKV